MLVTLGARNASDELVDLLAACHRRIRHHIVLARRLVQLGSSSPDEEVCDTASQIRRYFSLALPLHVADEDQTIAPQLSGHGSEVTTALVTVASEHQHHQPLIDHLVELCAEIEREPSRLGMIADSMSRLVEELATQLAAHLELEERVVFPALRLLSATQRAEMLAAIRNRREATLGTTRGA